MAVSDAVFILGLEFVIYLTLGLNWNFSLFKSRKDNDSQTNIIKIVFIWLIIWMMPLLTQYAMEDLTGDKLTLMTTLYQVNMWVAWVISVILLVFFIMNVAFYMVKLGEHK
jgi:hypothetical protein